MENGYEVQENKKNIIFSKNKVNNENYYFYNSSNAIEIVSCYKYLIFIARENLFRQSQASQIKIKLG